MYGTSGWVVTISGVAVGVYMVIEPGGGGGDVSPVTTTVVSYSYSTSPYAA